MDALKNVQDSSVIIASPGTKSWVASRFTLIDDAGVSKRRCKFADCGKEYSRGTSHMILKRHWSRQHADQFSGPSLRTNNANNHGNSPKNAVNNVFGNANWKSTKKKPLNTNNLPLPSSGAGGVKNKAINQNLNSDNRNSNQKVASLDVKLVAKRLKEANSIHLTFDIFTPKKGGKTYGIITAHSLSDSLDIKSVLLEYRHLPYPDDSSAIYEFLRSCITKFNIREKIVSLASNLTEASLIAVQEMDKRYRLSKNFNFSTVHIQCFPQFIHRNILEVLRSQELYIDNVRKVVGFINNNNITLRPMQQSDANTTADVIGNSTTPLESNNTSDATTKATGLKLPYDNRSSWNTTYSMIETFVQQRGFIEPTLLYFQNSQNLDVNIDWDRLFTLVHLLKPFYDAINKFSTDNYTPVSLIAALIPRLMDLLSSSSLIYEDLIIAAHNFKMQLETYRQNFQSDLTVIAGLLDPRIKDTFVTPEGKDSAIDMLRKRLPELKIYEQIPPDSIWYNVFRPYAYDEIADYFGSSREPGRINIFAYWEAHRNNYPNLYNLAKTLVCIQASSVPSDRMFSAADNSDRERKVQGESTNSKELMKSWAKYLEK